jgi:hypothetical protein
MTLLVIGVMQQAIGGVAVSGDRSRLLKGAVAISALLIGGGFALPISLDVALGTEGYEPSPWHAVAAGVPFCFAGCLVAAIVFFGAQGLAGGLFIGMLGLLGLAGGLQSFVAGGCGWAAIRDAMFCLLFGAGVLFSAVVALLRGSANDNQ